MKFLGKKPPKNDIGQTSTKFVPVVSMELAEHFRQSLLELSKDLETAVEVYSAPNMRNLTPLGSTVLRYANKAKVSAGCEKS